MFSFTPTKNITMGEGGIVLTNSADTAERLRLLRNHGQQRPYEHVLIGYNWRLTEIQAAIGRVQLRKLDAILARKRANADWMSRRLEDIPGITPPYQLPHARSVHMLYTCLVDENRDAVLARLLQAASKRGSISRPPISSRFSPNTAKAFPSLRLSPRRCSQFPCTPASAPASSPGSPTRSRTPLVTLGTPQSSRRSLGVPGEPAQGRVVGLGTMGRNHVRVLRDLPGVELVGATDPDPRARNAARAIAVTADLDSLLELGIDMCVVASPTLTHADVGLRLADAGVHALIEKPLTSDPQSGRLVAEAFQERGLIGAVGHIERYNPAVSGLQSRLAQGDLGSVFQVTTRRLGPFPQRIRDVGVVMDLATHDIDLTQWVTGCRYLTVTAFTAHPSGRRTKTSSP